MIALLLLSSLALAQEATHSRAILAREAQLYIAPDARSAKLGTVGRGREVAILDQSLGYLKVFANVEGDRDVTGWILDKGVVRPSTPNGDKVLFGEAADSEYEASRRRGRRGADRDALRLYYRMAEYFPKSELAGEALWRAADIRWQVERADVGARPSAKQPDPYLRGKMDEEFMNQVRKKYPGSKWADMADFAKLDNKICGEWQGLAKCPENESKLYEEYVQDHPNSPKKIGRASCRERV